MEQPGYNNPPPVYNYPNVGYPTPGPNPDYQLPPQIYPPGQNYPPQGYPPQGYPPQSYPPTSNPAQFYPPNNQGYLPQAIPSGYSQPVGAVPVEPIQPKFGRHPTIIYCKHCNTNVTSQTVLYLGNNAGLMILVCCVISPILWFVPLLIPG
jgi:XYPPX repeat (two copies)